MSAQIVTANRLDDGLVVYLDVVGGWTGWLHQAWVAYTEEEGAALLALAESPEQATRVVGPYLIDVIVENNRPRAASYREVIRAQGPSVRADLGKQAESKAAQSGA